MLISNSLQRAYQSGIARTERGRRSRVVMIAVSLFCCAHLAGLTAPAAAEQAPPITGESATLLAVIASDDATAFNKAKACQALAVVGDESAVPALAALLDDPQLAPYARYALEPMPYASVDDVLREALGRLNGPALSGVIGSIGIRQDKAAVARLIQLLDADDTAVARAAAWALGRIATPRSVEALASRLDAEPPLQSAITEAALTAADALRLDDRADAALDLLRAMRRASLPRSDHLAATLAIIRTERTSALPLIRELLQSNDEAEFRAGVQGSREVRGREVATLLADELRLTPARQQVSRQVLLIHAMGAIGDGAALSKLRQAAEGPADDVRRAAIQVLGSWGEASSADLLLRIALKDGGDAEAARQALISIDDSLELDRALVDRLTSAPADQQAVLVELIGSRGVADAVPKLLQLLATQDVPRRRQVIKALGRTVQPERLPWMIERMLEAPPATRDAWKEAADTALLRMPDRETAAASLSSAMARASIEGKRALLDSLGILGGPAALEAVAAAARADEDQVVDAATRVLGQWMTPDVSPVLLDLATTGPEKYRVRALRGYIRVIRQFGLSDQRKLKMCRQTLKIADRPEEKRLILETLRRVREPEALELVAPALDDERLRSAAIPSALAIAESIVQHHPAAVAAAMDMVLEVATDTEQIARARQLLQRAQRR